MPRAPALIVPGLAAVGSPVSQLSAVVSDAPSAPCQVVAAAALEMNMEDEMTRAEMVTVIVNRWIFMGLYFAGLFHTEDVCFTSIFACNK